MYDSLSENCSAFSQANIYHIKGAIDQFDWESKLNNIDVNEHVSVSNEIVINIMSNLVPNEIITCDKWDSITAKDNI